MKNPIREPKHGPDNAQKALRRYQTSQVYLVFMNDVTHNAPVADERKNR